MKLASKDRTGFVSLAVVLIILLTVAGIIFFLKSRYPSKLLTPPPQTTSPIPTQSPTLSLKPSPSVVPGFKQYTNSELRYGFNYPESYTLYECPDIPCLSVKQISLRVEILTEYEVPLSDPKSKLLITDFYCEADGPPSSTTCQNTDFEELNTSMGLKGFKIDRTKTVTGTGGIPAGEYPDHAYVFLLPEPINHITKYNKSYYYTAVLFSVDDSSQQNLNELDAIANSSFPL